MFSFTILQNYYKSYFYNLNLYNNYGTTFLKELTISITVSTRKIKTILYCLLILEFVLSLKCLNFNKSKKILKKNISFIGIFKLKKKDIYQFLSFFFFSIQSISEKHNNLETQLNLYSKNFTIFKHKFTKSKNLIVNFKKVTIFDLIQNRTLFDFFSESFKLDIKIIFDFNTTDLFIKNKIINIYGFQTKYTV
jgi:hypothetical protein